jgi:PHD/YefM family antitoxin component YafN of YafNO toxin-antitoxin module
MKQVTLRESQAPYTLSVDEETLAHEPVILQKNGQAVAVIIPFADYKAFRSWQDDKEGNGQSSSPSFEQDRAVFERMKPELLQKYSGRVVAIYQGQLVAVGDDIGKTAMTVYEKFGYVPCFVQRVEETPHVYKMTHRRVVR